MNFSLIHMDDASKCLIETSAHIIDPFHRNLITVFILLFSFFSISFNFLILFVVFVSWNRCREQVFIQFVLSMTIAGTFYVFTNFLVAIPCTFNYCSFFNSSMLIIVSLPNSIGYFVYLYANFGFSIYRFWLIIFRNVQKSGIIHLTSLYFPWIFSILLTGITNYRGCFKRFNKWSIRYTFNCSTCKLWFDFTFIDYNFYIGQILPILMCIFYSIIIIKILREKKRGSNSISNINDRKLAFQYLIICFAQYLSAFLFYIVPKYGNDDISAVILMNIIGSIDVAINPLILLLFNSTIRKEFLKLFEKSWKKPNNFTTTISLH